MTISVHKVSKTTMRRPSLVATGNETMCGARPASISSHWERVTCAACLKHKPKTLRPTKAMKTMVSFGVTLDAIDPRHHDKYSPNLHRWLAMRIRQGYTELDAQVYRDQSTGWYWIGKKSNNNRSFMGAKVFQVLYTSRPRDVTDGEWGGRLAALLVPMPLFWPQYLRKGRCRLDFQHIHHFTSTEERYRDVGKTKRVCRWCGAQLVRSITVERKRRETWVLAPKKKAH